MVCVFRCGGLSSCFCSAGLCSERKPSRLKISIPNLEVPSRLTNVVPVWGIAASSFLYRMLRRTLTDGITRFQHGSNHIFAHRCHDSLPDVVDSVPHRNILAVLRFLGSCFGEAFAQLAPYD